LWYYSRVVGNKGEQNIEGSGRALLFHILLCRYLEHDTPTGQLRVKIKRPSEFPPHDPAYCSGKVRCRHLDEYEINYPPGAVEAPMITTRVKEVTEVEDPTLHGYRKAPGSKAGNYYVVAPEVQLLPRPPPPATSLLLYYK
jgi:hypothetical protein